MGITKSKRRNSVSLSQKDKVRCLNCNAFKTESSKFHSSNTTFIGVGIMEEQQRQYNANKARVYVLQMYMYEGLQS